MKFSLVLLQFIVLVILQTVTFVGLYEIGFRLDIWITQTSPRLGISYGIGIYYGVRLFCILASINAAFVIFKADNKYKVVNILVCLFIFCWFFSGIVSTRPYKFLIILISGIVAFLVPTLYAFLKNKISIRYQKQSVN